MKRTFIIAEAGINHNGDLSVAKRMIDIAKEAGADAVKFQTFKADNLATQFAPKAAYQKKLTGKSRSQLNMLKKLELDRDAHGKLIVYCKKKRIVFLSSAFDLESVNLLCDLGLGIFKIPSGEITNVPYLRKIGALKKKIIMSTGMSDLREIRYALNVLQKAGTKRRNITLLHCTSEYPAPVEEVNLRAMQTLKNCFKTEVGYSDHTLGWAIAIAAVVLGAKIIEKHFTLDLNMKGPDHQASLDPDGFKQMVVAIRNIEKAMGTGKKVSTSSENKNKLVVRKSIVASCNIKKGEVFTENNLSIKRPGTGTSPLKWDLLIGKKAKKNFLKDQAIKL